ncbi:MAG: cyanophycinase [Myxococcota bacterium]
MTLVLIGGGTEEAGGWSDPLFAAIAEGHTVAVLGASESSEPGWYRDYLLSLGALDAEEIVIATRAEAEAADLSRFDAFFLRGGDQWDYVREWDDTPVEEAILAASVVGGTSAGAMVLGGVDYTAEDGGVDPEDVLARYQGTLATGFLDLLDGIVVDTHFTQRGRIGRLLPWVLGEDVVGIGVDDMTGVVIDAAGGWTVHGTGTVSEIWTQENGRTVLSVQVEGSPDFDLGETGWVGGDVRVEDGTEGTWTLLHPREDDLYCGTLEISPGQGLFDGIAVADAWEPDTVETCVGGAIYAMAALQLHVGLLLPRGTTVDILPEGGFVADGGSSAIVLYAHEIVVSDETVGWQDPDCEGPRLARGVAMMVDVLPPDGSVAFAGYGRVEDPDPSDSGSPAADEAPAGDVGCGCDGGSAAGIVPIVLLAGRRRRVW